MKVQRESAIERKCKLLAQQKGWFQVKIEKASVRGSPTVCSSVQGKPFMLSLKMKLGDYLMNK